MYHTLCTIHRFIVEKGDTLSSSERHHKGRSCAPPRWAWLLFVGVAWLLLGCATSGNDGATTTGVVNAGHFDRVWAAKGIDGNGAPLDPTTQFSVADAEIYVVAQIAALPAGTVVAQWLKDGQPYEDSQPLTVDAPLTQGYLHFYLRPDGGATTLEVGQYRVTLTVNGDPSISTDFQIGP